MHPDDAKSRLAGAFCLTAGAALTWWTWHSAMNEGHYSMKVAILGPTVLVLGLGLLGYFARPPRHRWTDLLYTALPFAMLLVWFLPSRVFGAPEAAAAPPTAPVAGPTNEPIDPK